MTDARSENGALLPDAERFTPLGTALRALSLDELPELVNVVRGQMSLVGPRPFIYDYMPLYSEQHLHRHDVRPGLTGLAQVMGRNGLSWERRFELDLEYIETMSFVGDVRIILRTATAVLRRHGINQGHQVTSERFMGLPPE
jgi:lipopolysaccharide/colanic/teichoic acid biosynthesis glycosyltransferase